MTRTLLLVALAVGILSGCAPNADGTGSPPPATLANALVNCPAGDTVWVESLSRAAADHSLPRLAEQVEEIAKQYPERWEPVWTLAECRFRMAQGSPEIVTQARRLYERALELALASDDPVGIARAANKLGWICFRDSKADDSERFYRQALLASRQAGREDLAAYINNNLAAMLAMSGRPSEALETQQAALIGLEKLGQIKDARWAAFNRATLLRDLGNLAESREVLVRLLGEASGQDQRLVARISQSLGNLHVLLDDLESASTWYSKVSRDYPEIAAATDLGLGRLALRQLSYQQAAEHLDRASAQTADIHVARNARISRAEVDLRLGHLREAQERLEPLIAEADRIGVWPAAYWARALSAKSLLPDPQQMGQALQLLREAVQILERQSEGLEPGGEGMTYLRNRVEPFADLAAGLATAQAKPEEILEVIEQAHARGLRRIQQDSPEIPLEIADLRVLQGNLEPGELLLDFLIGDDRGVVLAIRRDRVLARPIPGWLELREPLRRYRAALVRPLISAEARLDPVRDLARDVELGRKLRRQLLEPVEELLRDARRVYVVPDQDLALLPLAALPLEEQGKAGAPRFLGQTVELAVLPMAGKPPSWDGLRSPLLLAGDPLPDPSGEFSRLPLAGAELDRVRSIWRAPGSVDLRGADLALARLGALELDRFATIHLATHAVASSLDPRRCAVILSGGEKLGMQQIATMRLGRSLVVLSACRTGEGEVIPGEGVVGLTWAFLRAGARGVAASLWSVEDQSTAELMASFHGHLKEGHDPVRAMAMAQREVAASRIHPAYWAPFVVVLAPGTTS